MRGENRGKGGHLRICMMGEERGDICMRGEGRGTSVD